MKHLTQLGALLALVVASVPACDVETVEDIPTLTKAEAQALGGKSDGGLDFCDLFGWYGDGICDSWCAQPDPDCGPSTCEAIGGTCRSSPIDVTFPANCEADFGMAAADASCGNVINLACCVPVGDDGGGDDSGGGDDGGGDDSGGDDGGGDDSGGEPSACEAAGGECLSSPIDVTFGADCEGDYGMDTLDADCGFFNRSCCIDADDTGDDEPESCESLGGSCLGSPIDVTFGADCEGDYGLQTLDGECEFFNRTCCG